MHSLQSAEEHVMPPVQSDKDRSTYTFIWNFTYQKKRVPIHKNFLYSVLQLSRHSTEQSLLKGN